MTGELLSPGASGRVRLVAACAALVVAPMVQPTGLAGQEPVDTAGAAAPAGPRLGGWGAVDVSARPGNTVVSVTVTFPRGSETDRAGKGGSAHLLGRAVRRTILEGLGPAAGAATEVAVEVTRGRTDIRLVTLPRHWLEAYRVMERALFVTELTATAFEAARMELGEVLRFEEDAPHREFELGLYRLLDGVESPWSRMPRGDTTSVRGLDLSDLEEARARILRRGTGVVSVVGAVARDAAIRVLTGGGELPERGATATGFDPFGAEGSAAPAWTRGDRLVRTPEVTSTWIGIAYPVAPGTGRTALEMLRHRLDRTFNSVPPDPGAFDVEVRLELLGPAPLLMIEAALLPEAADQWERRILAAVEEIAGEPMEGAFFRAYRRRFRTDRLLRDVPPEVESLRRSTDLLLLGRARDLAARIDALGPDDLRDAARELGEPRIFVYGPDLSDEGPDRLDTPEGP